MASVSSGRISLRAKDPLTSTDPPEIHLYIWWFVDYADSYQAETILMANDWLKRYFWNIFLANWKVTRVGYFTDGCKKWLESSTLDYFFIFVDLKIIFDLSFLRFIKLEDVDVEYLHGKG